MNALGEASKRALSSGIKVRIKNAFNLDRRETFAQYGEDAILFSYFWNKTWTPETTGRPRLKRNGFFVDVGAYAPTQNSNTYLFYKRGWRGINVDPTPGVMDSFREVRPYDINLQVAVGASTGNLEFYSWGSPCVYNTLSAEVASERAFEFNRKPETIVVQTLQLHELLDRHLPPGQAIDFMTVDVEGMDLVVLQSNDWERYRPELLLVESYVYELALLATNPLHAFAVEQGYHLHAWTPPTLIYRDGRRGK